jgi:hypothetical protein
MHLIEGQTMQHSASALQGGRYSTLNLDAAA